MLTRSISLLSSLKDFLVIDMAYCEWEHNILHVSLANRNSTRFCEKQLFMDIQKTYLSTLIKFIQIKFQVIDCAPNKTLVFNFLLNDKYLTFSITVILIAGFIHYKQKRFVPSDC